MKIAVWLLYAVAGWCAIGLFGTVVSLAKGRRAEAFRNAAWLAAIGGTYLLVLIGVSVFQKQRVVRIGEDQCFGEICFRVTGVDEVPGLVAGSTDRVVRVRIAVTNRGLSAAEEPAIHAYLLDSRARQWEALPGLSGNPLTSRIAANGEIVGQPMFRVASDAAGLGLVLTHGSLQPRQFIIGDSDSLAHQPTIVDLRK